jgi:hypothetical protein
MSFIYPGMSIAGPEYNPIEVWPVLRLFAVCIQPFLAKPRGNADAIF